MVNDGHEDFEKFDFVGKEFSLWSKLQLDKDQEVLGLSEIQSFQDIIYAVQWSVNR